MEVISTQTVSAHQLAFLDPPDVPPVVEDRPAVAAADVQVDHVDVDVEIPRGAAPQRHLVEVVRPVNAFSLRP